MSVGNRQTPASDVSTCIVTLAVTGEIKELTVTSDVEYMGGTGTPINEILEDFQRGVHSYGLRHNPGTLTFSVSTDQDLTWLDGMREGSMFVKWLHGGQGTFTKVAHTTEGGVKRNATTGKTDALTFGYAAFTPTQAPLT